MSGDHAAGRGCQAYPNGPPRDDRLLPGLVSGPVTGRYADLVPGKRRIQAPRDGPPADGAPAAEAKAQDLISDAEALLALQRWPRAFALAMLAHEEFGKGLMALALTEAPPKVVQQVRLAELTGEHIRALLSAYQREALAGPPGLRDDALGSREIARDADELTQRAFYVDIADDGSLRLPSDIGEDEARALVARVRQIINSPG